MNRKVKYLLLLLSVQLALIAALVRPKVQIAGTCEICGTREIETAWSVRGTSWTLFRRYSIETTPISAVLAEKKLNLSHNHRWFAARQVSDPLNNFGPPVTEALELVNTARVINFTRNVADYADSKSVEAWKELVMQPHYSYLLDGALRYLRVPDSGFQSRNEFFAWWGGNRYALYNRLREETEPD